MTTPDDSASDAHIGFFEDMRIAALGSAARYGLSTDEIIAILARMLGKLCGPDINRVRLAINNFEAAAREKPE